MQASQFKSPSGSVFVESEPMHDMYAQGYALGGNAEGETESVVSCQDTGMFEEAPTCEPVKCFEPPHVKRSKSGTQSELTFSESAICHCDDGYSSDSSLGEDRSSLTAACGHEGLFESMLSCEKIRCPKRASEWNIADALEVGENLQLEDGASVWAQVDKC